MRTKAASFGTDVTVEVRRDGAYKATKRARIVSAYHIPCRPVQHAHSTHHDAHTRRRPRGLNRVRGHSYGRSTPRAHAVRAYGVAVGDIRPSLRCGFLSPTGTGPAPGLAQTRTRLRTRQVDSRCAPERDPTQTRAVATRRRTHAARSDSLCTLDRAVDTDRGRAYQYSRPIDSDGGLQPAFAL
jgi:hypothetical protein